MVNNTVFEELMFFDCFTERSGNDHVQVPDNKIEIRSPTPRMERTLSPPLMIIPTTSQRGITFL